MEWLDDQGVLRAETLACLHITAVTHRERAIVPIRLPGSRDAYWMRRAAERLFGPILKTVLPDVIDVHHVDETLIIARVGARADRHKVVYGLWGIVADCRRVVIVPSDVDPFDAQAVIDALLNGIDVIAVDDRFALLASEEKSSTPGFEADTALAERLTQLVGVNWTLYGGRMAIVGTEAEAFERIAFDVRSVFPDLGMVGVNADVNVCDFPFVLAEVIRWGWAYAAPGETPAVRAFHPLESEEWTPHLTADRWRALENDILAAKGS
ncbi:MAG: UbiD family decarboxylase [Anaerolineae bacterium]